MAETPEDDCFEEEEVPGAVTDMPEKMQKAKAPIIVQNEQGYEAIAGQADADQDGSDDNAAAAGRDRGDGTQKFPDEETRERPKKPPDAGCFRMKGIGPRILKTGILLMHLLLMMVPMIMISGPAMMNNYVGDYKLQASEKESVYTERDTMSDMEVIMKSELYPTGGCDNILRFDKSVDVTGDDADTVDGGGDTQVQIQDQVNVL